MADLCDTLETCHPLPATVKTCITQWSEHAQLAFHEVRQVVMTVAARTPIGDLTETLKWGHPAWLPRTPGIGSTLRCNWSAKTPDRLSLYVHCQTTLVDTLRELYPDTFTYEGNRALHMTLDAPLPYDAVDHCAVLTLTYHRKTT